MIRITAKTTPTPAAAATIGAGMRKTVSATPQAAINPARVHDGDSVPARTAAGTVARKATGNRWLRTNRTGRVKIVVGYGAVCQTAS